MAGARVAWGGLLPLLILAVIGGACGRPFYDNSLENAQGGKAEGYTEDEATQFNPSYEWQQVFDGQEIPAGLEVSLGLDGRGKFARIPQPWQLQHDLGKDIGFLRMMVTASTQVLEIKNEAAKKARVHSHCVNFHHYGTGFDGRALSDWETVGDVYWFHYRSHITHMWDQTPACAQLPKPPRKLGSHVAHEEVR